MPDELRAAWTTNARINLLLLDKIGADSRRASAPPWPTWWPTKATTGAASCSP